MGGHTLANSQVVSRVTAQGRASARLHLEAGRAGRAGGGLSEGRERGTNSDTFCASCAGTPRSRDGFVGVRPSAVLTHRNAAIPPAKPCEEGF